MYRVLIVEDEPIIQKGLQFKVNWLKSDCVVVDCADNGEEGTEKIIKLKPDIVITDIRMPFKNGLNMLLDTHKKVNYRTIILSGFSEFTYAKQAITIGVHDYLLKPIDIDEFEQTLKELVKEMDTKKAQETLQRHTQVYRSILNIETFNELTSSYITDAIELIKNRYYEKITLKEISEELQISSVYLNNKFKQETNYHFNDFLNRYRIMKSLEHLQNNKKLVYEVAEDVGFSEYKYFSSVFKKYVGMSPKQFLGIKV